MKKCYLFAVILSSNALAVPAPGIIPRIVGEGDKVLFTWYWGNGKCRIEGIPGFSREHGNFTYKTDYQLNSEWIVIGESDTSKREIAPRQICQVQNAVAVVTENSAVGEPVLIKPSMSLCYPADKDKPCPENAGIYRHEYYRYEWRSKHADSCEETTVNFPLWRSLVYKDYDLKTQYAIGETGTRHGTFRFRCTNVAGTFEYEKKVLIVEPPPGFVKTKNVEIINFMHGDYIYGKTKLYWSTHNSDKCSMLRSDGIKANDILTVNWSGYLVDVGFNYTLSCTGPFNSKASQTLNVGFVTPKAQISHFYSNKLQSGKANLFWNSLNTDACHISGSNGYKYPDVGTVNTVGFQVKSNAEYTLTCQAINGETTNKLVAINSEDSVCNDCSEITPVEPIEILNVESKDFEESQTIENENGKFKITKNQSEIKVYKFNDDTGDYVLYSIVDNGDSKNIQSISNITLE